MTKATIVTVTEDFFKLGPDWTTTRELYSKRDNKVTEMILAGKTTGSQDQITHGISMREWIDLAAAEEWKAFVLDINTQYGGDLIQSVDIEDIT